MQIAISSSLMRTAMSDETGIASTFACEAVLIAQETPKVVHNACAGFLKATLHCNKRENVRVERQVPAQRNARSQCESCEGGNCWQKWRMLEREERKRNARLP
jgi:proline racemase